MAVPPTRETVHVDVPRWGCYTSDADLFNAQMCRTRADLLAEVLERCAEERGDSSSLRKLRKMHLAAMLADFATGNRRNGFDDTTTTTTTQPEETTMPTTTTADDPCPQSGQLAPVFSHRGVPTITCSACDRRFLVNGYESVKRFPTHYENDGDASSPSA